MTSQPRDTDGDLEAALRRYRPAGPPAALRGRCVMVRSPRSWPLAAAAVLLLAFAAGVDGVASNLVPDSVVRREELVERHLAEWLGGRPADYALAQEIVRQASDREQGVDATTGGLAVEPSAQSSWETDK